MPLVSSVVGLLITVAGVAVLLFPAAVLALAQHPVTALQLYGSAVIRLGIGALFLMAAPASRMPRLIRFLGIFALFAGAATAVMGLDRAQAIADWMARQTPGTLRWFAVLPLALGGSIVYACMPQRRAA
jgi:hypothetical protein